MSDAWLKPFRNLKSITLHFLQDHGPADEEACPYLKLVAVSGGSQQWASKAGMKVGDMAGTRPRVGRVSNSDMLCGRDMGGGACGSQSSIFLVKAMCRLHQADSGRGILALL